MNFIPDTSTQLNTPVFTSTAINYNDIQSWTKINDSNLYNTSLSSVGIGTTNINGYKLNVNGSLNSSSLYQNGTQIDFASYATTTSLTNGLALKQDILTFNSPMTKSGSSVSIDLTNYYNKNQTDNINTLVYYNTKTEITNISNNNSNYTSNTSNLLKGYIDTNLIISSNYTSNTSNLLKGFIDTNLIISSNYTSNSLLNYYNKTDSDSIISNLYCNDINVYLAEKQYPSKAYDSSTAAITLTNELTNILPTTFYKETITINPYTNGHGIGTYNIYFSTIYQDTNFSKSLLFNYNSAEASTHWANTLYTAPNGTYNGTSYIVSGYTGDWIILKLPYKIILSKFRFYNRPSNQSRAPALWKCYGSMDGITFTEIIGASNSTTALTSSSYSSYYEQILSSTFNIPYLYIGFTFNKLVGGDAGASILNFSELQLYGKEQAKPFYVSSNVLNSNLTNYYNKTDSDDRYLKLTGGNMTGNLTTTGNIDCGGGIALTGSTAFFNVAGVDTINLTNTYINFKGAGAGNDWCYLRQIGTSENIKLALDFLDDANDARFCIRQNTSVTNPDTVTEVFTVDNGNLTITGGFSGTGGNITGINYNNITVNPLSFTSPLSKSAGNVVSIDLGSYSTTAQMTTAIGTASTNSSNYTSNTSNLLKADINQLITDTGYLNLNKENNLTFSSPLTRTTNTIGINLSSYSTTAQMTTAIGTASTNSSNYTSNSLLSYYTKTDVNGLTTLTNFYNKTDVNGISTLTNFYNKTDSDGRYLKLAGGNMTGNLTTTGNVGIGTATANNILQVGNAGRLKISNGITDLSMIGTLDIDGPTNTRIVISGNTRSINSGSIEYIATTTGNHLFYTTNTYNERMRINTSGNVGIGTNNPQSKLHITETTGTFIGDATSTSANSGSLIIDHENSGGSSSINFRSKVNRGSDYGYIQYQDTATNGGAGETAKLIIGTQNDGDDDILLKPSGGVGINTTTPNGYKLYVNGNTNINGNLTLNDTKITGSDNSRDRIWFLNNSTSYYRGHGTFINHEWQNTNGSRTMRLTNDGTLLVEGSFGCDFQTVANSGRDLTGIQYEETQVGDVNNTILYCIYNTFTGYHRVFTDDELFNIDEPQQFKNDYEGRIVVSTGEIATDTTDNGVKDNTEWEILYDKAGITIEDALPKIELSRKKKDKRVFGVLGDKRRSNNRKERLMVNSVGEGAIWVCNSNGNIENGDYITSSDYLGYGEKQDEIFLCNYTVAKATMDCDFQFDSPLYNCFEFDDGLRIAYIACTYHCG